MLKAHLAILLVGLGANQAFTSDDDRDRHWAEGVYFPPVTAPSVIQNDSRSKASSPARQLRRNPWPSHIYSDSVNQLQTPQSLGYPVEGYDPYQPSRETTNTHSTRPTSEYVPNNYTPGEPKEYYREEDRNDYRVNGFKSGKNYYRDEIRTGYYAHGDKRRKHRRSRGSYRRDYDTVDSDYYGKDYRHSYGLKGYGEALASGNYYSYDELNYDRVLGNLPYHQDWNAKKILDQSRLLQLPWEFMWPPSNSGLPFYPLW